MGGTHVRTAMSLARLLAREDLPIGLEVLMSLATQDMAAKLLTVVIENRLKRSSAFANGMLTGDVVAPSVVVAYGGPDPAEPVSQTHPPFHILSAFNLGKRNRK